MLNLLSLTEITPCDFSVTKCGSGCIATEHGTVCVCPEGSVLREDGHACTGTDIMTPSGKIVLKFGPSELVKLSQIKLF